MGNKLANTYKALADANRLKILLFTISYHIKELINANLITTTKQGKWVYCQINKKEFAKAVEFLNKFKEKEVSKI